MASSKTQHPLIPARSPPCGANGSALEAQTAPHHRAVVDAVARLLQARGMERVALFGATSAIAAEVARLYAARGAKVALLGRTEAKLQPLVAELGPHYVHHRCVDFTTCDGEAIVGTTIATLGGLDIAIIAHGDLGDQLQSERHFDAARQTLETNLLSVIALVIPLANFFEGQGNGHLAVLSSVAGQRGRPRNYTYGAAKGGLTTYMEGVRSRLWPAVGVHTIKLGPVDSPMTVDHPKNAFFATPQRVAPSIVRHLERSGGPVYVPWYWSPIMELVERLPETVFQRFKFLSDR